MKLLLIKRVKGQAMVVFLGFAAAMIGMMLVSFNSGQVTNAKMRAMNAADAAAYSGALWQARSLNFQAYMNRAMVVNEVTIAQSVSLRSWVDYIARFISNVNMVTQFIPYAGVVTKTISRTLDKIDDVVQKTLPPFEQASRALNALEHKAQSAFHADGAASAFDIAIDMAKKNGAQISKGGYALFALNTKQWTAFTETYSGNERKRLREVTLNSRDGFSQNREWEMKLPLGLVTIDKQGGTDLIDYDAWKAVDSAAICIGFKCPWVPLGWGGAQAYNPGLVTRVGTHGNSGQWTSKKRPDGILAAKEANMSAQATRLRNPFPNYRDLQDLNKGTSDQQKIAFAVEVLIPDTGVPTANSAFGAKAALTDGTTIEHDPQYATTGAGVYGLSEACVSFERPPGAARKDGATERPSLFNPYWHAALATPSKGTRGAVGIAKGLPPIDALFGGVGSCG